MLGHRLYRHVIGLGQFADRRVVDGQSCDQVSSRGISEGGEHFRQRIVDGSHRTVAVGGILNRMVENLMNRSSVYNQLVAYGW